MGGQVKNEDGQNDLAVLYPDREAVIGGRKLTVREYGFIEGLKLGHLVEPLVAALAACTREGGELTPDVLRPVFGRCLAQVEQLIAAACDQPVEWVRGLSDADGQLLMLLWWTTNADFFVRRVIEAIAVTQASAHGGPMPSPPSSPPGTAPTTLPGTPAAS